MKIEDILEAIEPMLNDRVRAELIRRKRVRLLTSNRSPFVLADSCCVFVHLVPCVQDTFVDFRNDHTMAVVDRLMLTPITSRAAFNFDGLRRYEVQNGKTTLHVQYFRSGVIELCQVFPAYSSVDSTKQFIPSLNLRSFILDNLPNHLQALKELSFQFPFIISVTMVGTRGRIMASGSHEGVPIDRDELWPEVVMLKDMPQSIEASLTHCLDSLWNASGLPRMPRAPG